MFQLEFTHALQELGQVGEQLFRRGFRVATWQVHHPHVGPKCLDLAGAIGVVPGKNVHLQPLFAQSESELAHIDVHTPRFPLTRGRQGACVE